MGWVARCRVGQEGLLVPDCEQLKHAARAAGVPAFDGPAGVGSESRTCDSLCLVITETISLVSLGPGVPGLAGCV